MPLRKGVRPPWAACRHSEPILFTDSLSAERPPAAVRPRIAVPAAGPGPVAMDHSNLPLAWFGSPWMLLWMTAAALPILLHLWNRRSHAEVQWAAMEFLLAALHRHARRLRIEQLLLLAAHVLVLVLLAVALADPVVPAIPGLGSSLASQPRAHRMLVLDASYSMDYRDGDASRFQRAQQEAAARGGRQRERRRLYLDPHGRSRAGHHRHTHL